MHRGFPRDEAVAVGEVVTIGVIEGAGSGSDWTMRVTATPQARVIVKAKGASSTTLHSAVIVGDSALISLGKVVAADRLVVQLHADGAAIDRAAVDIGWIER